MYITHHGTVIVKNKSTDIVAHISVRGFDDDLYDVNVDFSDFENITEGGYISFFKDGLYLSSMPDGTLVFQSESRKGWELFINVENELIEGFKEFVVGNFYSLFPTRKKEDRTGRPVFFGSEFFSLCGDLFSLKDNIRSASVFSQRRVLNLSKKSCEISTYLPFNPIIYYCAFSSEEQIDILRSSLLSCIEMGEYDGDILVFTDLKELCRTKLSGIKNKIHIVASRAEGLFQYWGFRYRVNEFEEFGKFGPFLYLDTDVAVDRPLQDTLVDIFNSSKICVYSESNFIQDRDSYGRKLLNEERLPTNGILGINSGVFGFRNIDCAAPFLEGVKYTMNKILLCMEKDDETFSFFDQSVANYILRKFGLSDFSVLDGKVRTFWNGKFEGGDMYAGFCHFTNKPKNPYFSEYVSSMIKLKHSV